MSVLEPWSSRRAFVFAAIGAAVGLGNIWKFPYLAGAHGGGAFVLVYVIAVFALALPLVVGEIMLGRAGHHSPPRAIRTVSASQGLSDAWAVIGWMGLAAAYVVLTYYSVIAGWSIYYLIETAEGSLTGVTAPDIKSRFSDLTADPVQMGLWHGVFMVLTAAVVGSGIRRGIERVVSVFIPLLGLILAVLVLFAAYAANFSEGLRFLFRPDFERLDPTTILMAVGQAFFSVSVAVGIMMAYGAHLAETVSVPRASLTIVLADTGVALLAGLAIFPVAFANGLEAEQGPGLVFVTMPIAFAGMPGGQLVGLAFFALLVIAAITSSVALLETFVTWAIDGSRIGRHVATWGGAVGAWLVGLLSVFSFNLLSNFAPLGFFDSLAQMTFFDLLDGLVANVLMPVGGLLMALFIGWRLDRATLKRQLQFNSELTFNAWYLLIRYLVPAAIAVVLTASLWSVL